MRISKMQDQECREMLRRLSFGRLGCARDNQPYVIPIYFAYERDRLYGFATVGQKIEWMRSNPRVCLQCDEVISNDQWTSIVVLGRYEELPDTPDYAKERIKAQSLLEKRSMWWQTSYIASTVRDRPEAPSPVFYCIHIEKISGLSSTAEGAPVRVR